MRITKNMLHDQLKSKYWAVAVAGFLFTKAWGINLVRFVKNFSKGKNIKGLDCKELYIPSKSGGPDIRIRIFKPLLTQEELPCMLFLHGGGYMALNPEVALETIKQFIETRACVIVAPDYRKSTEAPYPAGFNDCYDTLLWVKENTGSLGIRSDQFIIGGQSAGGGLTAAITLKARDTKEVNIAFQMPIYPMIDDRQSTDSAKQMTLYPWNTVTNKIGWGLYLKDLKESNTDIPSYAAPARNHDYTDFPPTITFVGELEPFKDETIAYVEELRNAGVHVEFELYDGCFHAFDTLAPDTDIGKQASQFLMKAYGELYDRYFSC